MYNRQCNLLLVNVSLFVMILSSVFGYYYLQEPDILSNKPTMHRITDIFIDSYQPMAFTSTQYNQPMIASYECVHQSSAMRQVLPLLLTHNVATEFHSFSKDWIGNTLLLREILTEIAHKHPHIPNKIKKHSICHETEHSLVLPGGRDLPMNTPMGKVPSMHDQNTTYTVRMCDCELLHHDIVVQYSIPNILNFALSGLYQPSAIEKMVYIPAIEYDFEPFHKKRELTPFTTFNHPTRSRRNEILSTLWERGIRTINYKGISSKEDMMALYDSKAILINIHQTPHHHTMEELRLLPALLRGLVIVAEESPLITSVPYSDFIIWTSVDDMPSRVLDVITNYEVFFEKFFGPNSTLPCILINMRKKAFLDMENRVLGLK
jgi:hypothetical protein